MICSTCGRDKAPGFFNRNRSKSSGFNSQCKPCFKKSRGKRSTRVCQACRRPFNAKDRTQKFCSYGCALSHRPDYTREKNPNWRGGETISSKGYVYVNKPEHPNAVNGYVKRANLVAEGMLGRLLRDDEEVHHKNKNKLDDRPENLEVMTRKQHAQHHGNERRKPRAPKKPLLRYNWPPLSELKQRVRDSSLRKVAREIGCSHIAVYRRVNGITS